MFNKNKENSKLTGFLFALIMVLLVGAIIALPPFFPKIFSLFSSSKFLTGIGIVLLGGSALGMLYFLVCAIDVMHDKNGMGFFSSLILCAVIIIGFCCIPLTIITFILRL